MYYVSQFNKRQLTFPEDTLNSMQSIIHTFACAKHPLRHFMVVPVMPPVAFCLGVTYRAVPRSPEESFLIGLCWYCFGPGRRRPQFPSWSWASWDRKLSHNHMFERDWQCRLDDCKVWIKGEGETLHKFPSEHEKLYNFLSQSVGRDRFIRIETKTLPCKISYTPLTKKELPSSSRKRPHVKMFLEDGPPGLSICADIYCPDTEIEYLGRDLRTEVDTALTGVILGDLSLRDANACIVAIIVKENREYAARIDLSDFNFAGYNCQAGLLVKAGTQAAQNSQHGLGIFRNARSV